MAEQPILIIPARGGSRRLPRKNILSLGDRPVLTHVVDNAIESQLFSRIIVSTEDSEIAAIAANAGALVHDRPVRLAEDRSTVVEVCGAVLEFCPADLFCCVYPTAALLSPATLQGSFALFDDEQRVDYVMGVSRYSFPPVQALKVNDDGFAALMWPEFERVQSQFHPELCVSNGTLYWARSAAFTAIGSFYGPGLRPFYVPEEEVCDVNTAQDFKHMRTLYEARQCRL